MDFRMAGQGFRQSLDLFYMPVHFQKLTLFMFECCEDDGEIWGKSMLACMLRGW